MALPPVVKPLTQEEKESIIKKLKEKGVVSHCPMCANDNFILVDGYFVHIMQNNPSMAFVVNGPSVPSIAIVCSNCGFMSQHAIGALGLLNEKEGPKP